MEQDICINGIQTNNLKNIDWSYVKISDKLN